MGSMTKELLGAGLDWLIPRLKAGYVLGLDREKLVRKWDLLIPSAHESGELIGYEERSRYAVLFETAARSIGVAHTGADAKLLSVFSIYIFPVLLRFARLEIEALGTAVANDDLQGFVKSAYSKHAAEVVELLNRDDA